MARVAMREVREGEVPFAAGDAADATSDGGSEPPPGEEPDLKDAGAAQRRDAKR